MANNPNPGQITDAMWRMWTEAQKVIPGVKLGGIYANKSGYHNTVANNRRNWPGNYSIQLSLDKTGPTTKARALDLTMSAAAMKAHTQRLLNAAAKKDPRLKAVREFYGTTNGSNVVGRIKDSETGAWRSSTSDSSHLWHIHISIFTKHCNTWSMLAPIIAVLAGTNEWKDDDVSVNDVVKGLAKDGQLDTKAMGYSKEYTKKNPSWAFTTGMQISVRDSRAALAEIRAEAKASKARDEAILKAVKGTDTKAILSAIDAYAAKDAERNQELAELVEGFGTGQLNAQQVADQVVAIMGDRLSL